jgi:formylglycine-generating enzyme required for sulfatase activity
MAVVAPTHVQAALGSALAGAQRDRLWSHGGVMLPRLARVWHLSLLSRHRSTIAPVLGLGLLAAAFAYRWVPETANEREAAVPEAIGFEVVLPVENGGDDAAAPDSASDLPIPSPRPAVPPKPLDTAARAEIEDLLARAVAAERSGHLVLPEEENAADLYGAVLEINPGDESAYAGRQRVLTQTISQIDEALDSGDPRPVSDLLAALANFDTAAAEHQRLVRRREALPELEVLLKEAARRMVQGQRFAPEGDSALDSYRAALAVDARSRVAREGLDRVQQAMTAAALEAAGNDQFDEADVLMSRAAELGADTPVQRDAELRMSGFRGRRALSLVDAARAALSARDVETAAGLVARAKVLAPAIPGLGELEARVADAKTYGPFGPGESFDDAFIARDGRGPTLVVVPTGSFEMGSPGRERGRRANEGPLREVIINRPFAMARTEITVRQFREFVEATGHVTRAEHGGRSAVYDARSGRMTQQRRIDWRRDYQGEPARDDDPVVHVAWDDAHAYAQWLSTVTGKSYRLPSEAEHEYVQRAASSTRFHWGDGDPETVIGNFTGLEDRSATGRRWTLGFPGYSDGFWGPAPVASFVPNAFGLHDVDGNVAEWVEDCWHDSYLRAPVDNLAWVNPGCPKRVVRGGSWGSAPEQFRSAYRASAAAELRSGRTGFRVARDLK